MQNYDLHHVFQEVGKYNFKINVIPKKTEKYISFTIQQLKEKGIKPRPSLVFIDRTRFFKQFIRQFGYKFRGK